MSAVEREYPLTRELAGAKIELRRLEAGDRDAILGLAGEVSEHDRLFLRRDISSPAAVNEWVRMNAEGAMTTLLAFEAGALVGLATLEREHDPWSSHVAELRILVGEGQRGRGLGRLLAQEGFALALAQGIEKMTARMTPDQRGAIRTFEGLGFRPEALLRDHVKDRQGKRHDLLVLAHEVEAFEAQLEVYGVTDALDG